MRPIFNAIMIILKKHLVKFKLIFVLFIILLPFFSIAKDSSIDKNKLQLYFNLGDTEGIPIKLLGLGQKNLIYLMADD